MDLMLALELRDSGLPWLPAPGDRFVLSAPEMVDELFHLADMVIETRPAEGGTIFAFNGTTEWALDSVEMDMTVWLPREDQLRAALGTSFVSLDRADDAFEVTALVDGVPHLFTDDDPENAYALALAAVLRHARPSSH